MTAALHWVDQSPGRRLAILARPRGGDWLGDEINSWREQGIQVVVSMLVRSEVDELGLAEEANLAAAAGMEFILLPVPDRGVPPTSKEFAAIVARLSGWMGRGKAVGIHCRAGIGRSAMLAAALLISDGLSPAEAFDRVKTARGCPVPDTPEQRRWVEQFAENLATKAV
jgi:protein-tyrosine phosphatase